MWLLITGPTDNGKPYTRQIEKLYHDQYSYAVNIALSILHHKKDAEDAAADAVIHIINNADIIFSRPESNSNDYLKNLLYNCVRNAARDRLRRKKVFAKRTVPIEENISVPSPAENDRPSIKIWELLNELPPKYKDVLDYAAHGMSVKEIATMINSTEDNVRHIKSRGLNKLRKYLDSNNLTMDDFLEVV